jgi:hypothetical protein
LPYIDPRNLISLGGTSAPKDSTAAAPATPVAEEELAITYEKPKPRTAFSSFIDHPNEFIEFLEACLQADSVEKEDKVDLYTALFEMYLYKASKSQAEERTEWEAKAKRLVESDEVSLRSCLFDPTLVYSLLIFIQIPIDTSNVLLLSHLSDFRDGTILVREKKGLRFDIFRSYTSAKDTAGTIKALKKYGPEEPQLYPAALAYFTSSPEILEEAGDELDAVLKKIDEDGLMAPLQVIQTLSTNAVATMGMVKKYLADTVERERKEIAYVSPHPQWRLATSRVRLILLSESTPH